MMSSSKNSEVIDFPINDLDMSKFVLNSNSEDSNKYELYAVSNHSGSLYGGHYIANCKNSIDGNWYCFNDSSAHWSSES